MISVGFILLTHSQPNQVLSLTQVLNALYGAPPIVCHHDFSQCALDKKQFSGNVQFVEPSFSTHWGGFSVIPATLAAFRQIANRGDAPDWVYLLSGSDYPVAPASEVMHLLSEAAYDAFIDHREISCDTAAAARLAMSDNERGFGRALYRALAYRRYLAVAVKRPSLQKPLAIPPVGKSYLMHPFWRHIVPGPFSNQFRCFAGEHWFTANQKAISCLLAETGEARHLFEHLRRRECPEECYYHTILGNASLRLCTNNLRYIDWPSPDAWHPKTLDESDVPRIRASGAHFARKIEWNSPLMQSIDRFLGIHPQPISA